MFGVNRLNLATFSVIQVDCVSHLLYGIRTKNTSFHSLFIYTAVIWSRHANKLYTSPINTHSGKFEQISLYVEQN